jgi:GTP diphosphokinase / guanosine-3',5'-bis(diphosphate) 3'-diphosphatase
MDGAPTVLDKAIAFAADAHRGQLRKGTSTPYVLHPLEAAAIVATMTDDLEVIAAAALHDVLEDGDATEAAVREAFGDRIAALVASETEDKRRDRPAEETWRIRKQETVDRLRQTSDPAVKMLAIGDKLSNMRAIQRDFQVHGDRLWARFNQKSKAQHAWYYRSVAEATNDLSRTAAWQEYYNLTVKVFSDK